MKLGAGTYGVVKQIDNKAVKSFKDNDQDAFIIESTMCKYLTSDYTVACTAFNFDDTEITMELGTPIQKYVQKSNKHLKSAVDALISAVKFMHSRGIVHLDIKPANIVVVDNKIKLIDFGLSDYISDKIERDVFSLFYRPPELLTSSAYILPNLDMWALGITILELIIGYNPIEKQYIAKYPNPKIIKYDGLLEIIKSLNVEKLLDVDDKDYYNSILLGLLELNPFERNYNCEHFIPFEIPFQVRNFYSLSKPMYGIIIGWVHDLCNRYGRNMHINYLACKIFNETVSAKIKRENLQSWAAACIKLAFVLYQNNFSYESLARLCDGACDEESIKLSMIKILNMENYNVRENDSYLYLYQTIMQTIHKQKDYLDYKQTINKFYLLSTFNPEFFNIDPQLLLHTFFSLYNNTKLDPNQQPILDLLIDTLKDFDTTFSKKTNVTFDATFRIILNK